jgi:hypothetical protein
MFCAATTSSQHSSICQQGLDNVHTKHQLIQDGRKPLWVSSFVNMACTLPLPGPY